MQETEKSYDKDKWNDELAWFHGVYLKLEMDEIQDQNLRMALNPVKEIFDQSPAGAYDERNKKLAPISDNLHFLSGLVLKDLPATARVLCVGVGTGAEILGLARMYPGWKFLGVDPSSGMLADCEKRVAAAGLSDRVELFHGYLSDYVKSSSAAGTGSMGSDKFDAVICVLVMHFVRDMDESGKMFRDMYDRLAAGGYLINAEISFDQGDPRYPDILEKWKQVQVCMGATEASLAALSDAMKANLLVLPPEKTEELIRGAGFAQPVQFFQSLLIHGWYAKKD